MAFEPREEQSEIIYEENRIYSDEELNNYTDEELKDFKIKHEIPMCEDLETGPWPSFVADAKRGALHRRKLADDRMMIERDVIEDLTKRMNDLGFLVTIKPERADMNLKINIDALVLPGRNERLKDRSTFGLTDGEAMMTYTAVFTDSRTFKEIAKKTETYKTSKYFPSKDELREKFFSQMKDDILKYMSQYGGF